MPIHWGDFGDDGCVAPGRRKYSSRLWDIPWGTSWESACATTAAPTGSPVAGRTPDACVNKGAFGMWGEWSVDDASCRANWDAIGDNGCVAVGMRKYSSILRNIPPGQTWEDACATTPGPAGSAVAGQQPTTCANKGVLGMWGEWLVADAACRASWGAIRDDGCTPAGTRKYSAIIWNVPPGQTWEDACATTAGPAGTAVTGRTPDKCVNTGINEWGEWLIPDASCAGAIAPSGSWSEMFGSADRLRDIAVASNADGRLEVFGISCDERIWHAWQTTPGGAWSGSWVELHGPGDRLRSLEVGVNQDGRLEVFGISSDDRIWHTWQMTPGGAWNGAWVLLHSSTDRLRRLAVERNHDGRLEVFGIDPSDRIWHTWQTAPGGAWNGAWTFLHSTNDTLRSIDVVRNLDGRLEAFGVNRDGRIWHTWQTSPGGTWNGSWAELYGSGDRLSKLRVGRNQDGRLEVFGISSDMRIWHTWQTSPGGAWSGSWTEQHSSSDRLTVLDVGRNQDGRLEVVGISADERIWHTWQTTAGGAWNGSWAELHGSADRLRSLDVGSNKDGRIEVFGVNAEERIWHTWQTAAGAWPGPGAAATTGGTTAPTIGYADVNGYTYVETSERWKQMCLVLPCFLALQWPDYATTIVEDVIDGQPVVIQLWKGWCQKFLGMQNFPGGIGAEVGIYRRIIAKAVPTSLPFLPPAMATAMLAQINAAAALGDQALWWPFPELNARVDFKLINPVTGRAFFCAGPETSYWMNKWMNEGSYEQYRRAQGRKWRRLPAWFPGNANVPTFSVGYILEYKINGKTYPRW